MAEALSSSRATSLSSKDLRSSGFSQFFGKNTGASRLTAACSWSREILCSWLKRDWSGGRDAKRGRRI